MGVLDCIRCGKPVDASGPAVCEYTSRESETLQWGWVEFVEDWRGGTVSLLHPVCFAEAHGVEKLVEVVHRRDEINRGVVPKLMAKIEELRRQLGRADRVSATSGHQLPTPPDCPAATGPVDTTVNIGTRSSPVSFDQSCYYAAANQPLTINFTNSLMGGSRLTLLVSSPSDPVFRPVAGRPGVWTGSTATALFVGTPVTSPDTGVMSVPPLPAGAYVLQVLQMPYNFIATLVVQ